MPKMLPAPEIVAVVGEVFEETAPIYRLQSENDRLRRAMDQLRSEHAEAQMALSAVRKQLLPIYQALQTLYGHLDRVDGGGSAQVEPKRSLWESWKQKLGYGSAAARVIDALLEHGALTAAQLRVAAKMANQTVYDAAARLNRLGLIEKHGGRYSLKSL